MKSEKCVGKYVKPFTPDEIELIKAELKLKSKRDYCLFVMAINQGIRSTDLLNLRIKDVEGLNIGDKFTFKEGKTGKLQFVYINNATYEALHIYLDSIKDYNPNDFLFKSRSGNKAITLPYFCNLIQQWCKYANVKNPNDYGVRSLRKTFGRVNFDISENPHIVTLLKERFNHSSESMTIKYLDITSKDIEALFTNI